MRYSDFNLFNENYIHTKNMNSIHQLDQKTFNNLFSNFDIEKDFSI